MNTELLAPVHRRSALPLAAPVPTELDARGPTPPHHLRAIMTALAAIPDGTPQHVRTRTEPNELLHALRAQGVRAEAAALPDGTWRIVARRVSSARG